MPITITAKHDGYRRCGIVHSTTPVTYPDDRFGASDIDRLRRDPHLIVVEPIVDDQTAAAARAASISSTVERITEDQTTAALTASTSSAAERAAGEEAAIESTSEKAGPRAQRNARR